MEGPGQRYWDADVAATAAASMSRGGIWPTKPYEGDPIDLTCFISCYNESAYVTDTISTICAALREVGLSFEIIVIDDHSKDDSVDRIRAYIESHPDDNILLRANKTNRGLAQNYVDCAFLGRGKYFRLFCGDNAEPKESIVGLVRSIGDADCIVPYRASDGRTGIRHFISSSYTNIINAITGHRVTYYNGSSVHLRHNVMRWHTNTKGFGFQAEILCLLLDLGFTYKEVNIVAQEQREGRSNALNARNVLSVAHTLIEIANRRISNWVYKR